ncbi:MAG: ADP-ribosyltransferase, partial [Dolichospermum sp.]
MDSIRKVGYINNIEKTRRQKQMKLKEYTQEGYKKINSLLRKNKNHQVESE